jgi:hypothetical protein
LCSVLRAVDGHRRLSNHVEPGNPTPQKWRPRPIDRGPALEAHPLRATLKRAPRDIPATRPSWDAERGRAMGASDPVAWSVAADRWQALGYQQGAGYARWRQAEAILAAPHSSRGAAAAVLSTAAGLAVEHVLLTRAIRGLARRPHRPEHPGRARAGRRARNYPRVRVDRS